MLNRKQTEPQLSKYLHAKGRKLGLPIAGNFELTARCNFDCPMCYVHLKSEDVEAAGRELSAEQWISIAREAKDEGMVFALLTGGEPFVRRDFFEIYHAMKQMGIMVSINSNGSMLKGEVLRRLIDDPPFRVNVSLYGGSNETYRRMCGRATFDDVIENIGALKNAGIDVRLNVSVTPYNECDVEDICACAERLGVHMKLASYMYPSVRVNGGKYGYGDRLSPEKAAAASVRWDILRFDDETFSKRAEAMAELRLTEEPECPVDSDEGVGCRAGSTSFWMTWDGRMVPCGMMTFPVVYPLELGFKAAWQELRRATSEIRLPPKCKTCPKRSVCAMCAAVCVTETGEFGKVPEYVCRMTDAVISRTKAAYEERKSKNGN